MQCHRCHTKFLVNVPYCPTCGAIVDYSVSSSESSPYDPTVASPSVSQVQASMSPTYYGPQTSGMQQQNPYDLFNPYTVSLQAPPPPRSRYRRPRIVVGSTSGIILTAFGVAALFGAIYDVTSPLPSVSSLVSFPYFIFLGIIICVGTFVFCRNAVAITGKYMLGFSIITAAILFLYGFLQSSVTDTKANFVEGCLIVLLGSIFWWGTRKRKW